MSISQNGWPVLFNSVETFLWKVPVRHGETRHYRLVPGAGGFLLVHFLLWWHEVIEPINTGVWDEWGWAVREIRGQTSGYSNHASGTAADVNATLHPLGVVGTLKSAAKYARIRAKLTQYRGCLRWGGDYHDRKDEMHIELNRGHKDVRKRAHKLARTSRGKRILHANGLTVRDLR